MMNIQHNFYIQFHLDISLYKKMVNPITMMNIQHNFYIQFHLDISLLYHHEIVLTRSNLALERSE